MMNLGTGQRARKNDETLKAGEAICRNAIEKYYGEDALKRFKEKEEASKQSLSEIYENPIWKEFTENLDNLISDLESEEEEVLEDEVSDLEAEERVIYIYQETGRGGQ